MITTRLAITIAAISAGMCVLGPNAACAQQGFGIGYWQVDVDSYPYDTDTVSPYLLLRVDRRTGSIINYHTLVRPRLQLRQERRHQQLTRERLRSKRSTSSLNRRRGAATVEMSSSRRPSRFTNYSHYFPSSGRLPR